MASRYKQFLQLLKQYPVVEDMGDLSLAKHIQEKVQKTFRYGDSTQIDEKTKINCDKNYESLKRIFSNHHKDKYVNNSYINHRPDLKTAEINEIVKTITKDTLTVK